MKFLSSEYFHVHVYGIFCACMPRSKKALTNCAATPSTGMYSTVLELNLIKGCHVMKLGHAAHVEYVLYIMLSNIMPQQL